MYFSHIILTFFSSAVDRGIKCSNSGQRVSKLIYCFHMFKSIFMPPRACGRRHYVVGLSGCLSVCLSLRPDYIFFEWKGKTVRRVIFNFFCKGGGQAGGGGQNKFEQKSRGVKEK